MKDIRNKVEVLISKLSRQVETPTSLNNLRSVLNEAGWVGTTEKTVNLLADYYENKKLVYLDYPEFFELKKYSQLKIVDNFCISSGSGLYVPKELFEDVEVLKWNSFEKVWEAKIFFSTVNKVNDLKSLIKKVNI